MTGSGIAGWVLFILGVAGYLVSLWGYVQKRQSKQRLESLTEIKETVEAIAKLAEAFAKFSEDIQFLLISSGFLFGGIYLLVNQPF